VRKCASEVGCGEKAAAVETVFVAGALGVAKSKHDRCLEEIEHPRNWGGRRRGIGGKRALGERAGVRVSEVGIWE